MADFLEGQELTPEEQQQIAAAQEFYANYIQQYGIDTWGTPQNGVDAYIAQRRSGKTHEEALQSALGYLGWDQVRQTQQPQGTQEQPGGTPGYGGAGMGGLLAPYQPPPPGPGLPPLPEFNPPTYEKPPPFSFDRFEIPTLEQARQNPGYEFARSEGERGLQQSAAAKGVLNTGGTLKDLISWGNRFADQNYQNVFNRDLSAYGRNFDTAAQTYATNLQSQYLQPYQFAYQAAWDRFQPSLLGYSTTSAYNQRQDELNQQRSYQQYRDRKLDDWNILSSYFNF